jgi:hypothetical protein
MTPFGSTSVQWVGALATCTAVAVALFGPALRNWWRRPRLTLQHEPGTLMGDELIFAEESDRSNILVVTLVVTNHGRGQADGVEAILDARQRFGPIPADDEDAEIPMMELPVVLRGALRFELSRPGVSQIDIPPRSSRTLQFAMLGSDRRIREELEKGDESASSAEHPVNGLFTVLPAEYSDRYIAMPRDAEIGVEVQLQARNARPTAWRARVKAWEWSMNESDDGPLAGVSLEWLQTLRRVRSGTLPTPRRARLQRNLPWERFRHWRFQQELTRIQEDANSE